MTEARRQIDRAKALNWAEIAVCGPRVLRIFFTSSAVVFMWQLSPGEGEMIGSLVARDVSLWQGHPRDGAFPG